MSFTPRGQHLIAGEWIGSSSDFLSEADGLSPLKVSEGGVGEVERAAQAAETAFWTYGYTSRETRAAFLEACADEIEARGQDLTRLAMAETGLPEARLNGERGRTTGQLRLFAEHIRKGDYLDRRHVPAQPDRAPAPRPDLKLVQRPIGPVAVFGASNFPLAFSTAGGDTASALAAGCPVIVKGHPAHPRTGELVAEAMAAAATRSDIDPGVFSLIQGASHTLGSALVSHPLVRAVGFTGSLRAGRALFDLCAARPEPIPFYGELGSINPVFLMPGALTARSEALGAAWAGSLTLGAGQFCTNPGVVFALAGAPLEQFLDAAKSTLEASAPQTMLTDDIANNFRIGCASVSGTAGVETVFAASADGRTGAPALLRTSFDIWQQKPELAHEVFGPSGLAVTLPDTEAMRAAALSLAGQLTCTLHLDESDTSAAAALMPILERKAGRVLVNGFPTGVEVSDAMVHGGPYPATTNFGATSVGTLAIRRFLRPVCYQDMPDALLPRDLL
ncbi:MAG: aldehyde dehydrogenase (NADP(+)) [Hyphomonadaceae bacterium]|nr:aldehyde dehydrogenase (NADP(+)) [Hyphomonadaceae bacterium]